MSIGNTPKGRPLVCSFRVDIKTLATLIRFYSSNNIKVVTKSTLINTALCDFTKALIENNLVVPIVDAKEALSIIKHAFGAEVQDYKDRIGKSFSVDNKVAEGAKAEEPEEASTQRLSDIMSILSSLSEEDEKEKE